MVKLSADQRRFHQAAESDNVSSEKLKEIIEKIVNSRDELGATPLHKVSEKVDEGAVQYLIDIGANVNVQDQNGDTPLYVAVFNGQLENVKCLIENGATIDNPDSPYWVNTGTLLLNSILGFSLICQTFGLLILVIRFFPSLLHRSQLYKGYILHTSLKCNLVNFEISNQFMVL